MAIGAYAGFEASYCYWYYGSDLAGAEEAGDDGGRDAVVGRNHRLQISALLSRRSRRRGETPARPPGLHPRSGRCPPRSDGVGARGGPQASAEQGGTGSSRGCYEGRRRSRGGGAERRHGGRSVREWEWISRTGPINGILKKKKRRKTRFVSECAENTRTS
jgi:hypothetical protein